MNIILSQVVAGAVKIGNIIENQPNPLQANYEIVVFSHMTVFEAWCELRLFRFCMLLNVV